MGSGKWWKAGRFQTRICMDKDQSRYDVINNIMFAYAMQDETMLSESMRKYVSMDDTVKKLFKLL